VAFTGEPVLLKQGECFLLPHGWAFRLASDPALPPDDWQRHFLASRDGTLVRLNDGDGVTVLGGHFQLAGPQAEMLLGVLPPVVHLQSETDRESLRWAFDRMRQELTDLKPGSFLIVQQLVYMIFVQALRLHLEEGKGVGWLFAFSDKHVGAAITAIHREPARRWTVASLAAEVGMSRSGFAARFWQLVGDGRSNISPAGACCSPDAACRAESLSVRSPARSGMNRKVRSARPSSA
jgi:hypothetical protein